MFSASAISLAVGSITGMMAFTNALVMLDFRDIIVCTDGIRKTERRCFASLAESSGVIADLRASTD
jgi:hypothetical protein